MSTRILQIMPANGWRAIYIGTDGKPFDDLLAAWALIEYDDEDAPEGCYRYLAGLAACSTPGLVQLSEEIPNFAFYLPVGQQIPHELVATLAKHQALITKRLKPQAVERFDEITRQKQRAIEILSRKWPDSTEGKAEAIRKLRFECDEAATWARDIRKHEQLFREANASNALVAEAEALAAAELAGAKEPAALTSEVAPR
jgi:hypothetical protein